MHTRKLAQGIPVIALCLMLPALSPAAVETDALTSSDGVSGDNFGSSVDVDGMTAVVGASFADIGGVQIQGAAYVFDQAAGDGSWSQTRKLVAPDGAEFDQFGFSVGISGNTIVVGAEEAAIGANSSQGAAYVFERNAGGANNWGFVKKLEEPTSIGNLAEYGHSVAIDGDLIVVGAPKAASSAHGRAYVYGRDVGSPGGWGRIVELQDDIYDTNASFGTIVALDGDFLAVGAELLDMIPGTYNNEGGVYVFDRNYGGVDVWGQVAKLFASDAGGSDHLGRGVSISGTTVAAGAMAADIDGYSEGKAYIWRSPDGSVGSWTERAALTASDYADFSYFGHGVAVADGVVCVGAHGMDLERGKGYRYDMDEGGVDNWGEVDSLTASDGASAHYLGSAMAADGTLLAVSAYGNGPGKVYLYDLPGGSTDAAGAPAARLRLLGNHPNPFNPATNIAFELAAPARVEVRLYDLRGREVARPAGRDYAAGRHAVAWDAAGLASGVYHYRVSAGGRTLTGSCVLAK